MATVKHCYEVIVPGWRTTLERLGDDAVAYHVKRGYTVTPLVLATAERVAALKYAIARADFSELRGHEVLAVLDAMLQEMKGEATDGR